MSTCLLVVQGCWHSQWALLSRIFFQVIFLGFHDAECVFLLLPPFGHLVLVLQASSQCPFTRSRRGTTHEPLQSCPDTPNSIPGPTYRCCFSLSLWRQGAAKFPMHHSRVTTCFMGGGWPLGALPGGVVIIVGIQWCGNDMHRQLSNGVEICDVIACSLAPIVS